MGSSVTSAARTSILSPSPTASLSHVATSQYSDVRSTAVTRAPRSAAIIRAVPPIPVPASRTRSLGADVREIEERGGGEAAEAMEVLEHPKL